MRHSTSSIAHRYAVSYAPNPGSLGWLAGSHWLGRCAALLQPLQQPEIEGVCPQDLLQLTAAPRIHGWHAALMTPFALAAGTDWVTLHHEVQTVAHSLEPVVLPPLHVERIDDFLALVPLASTAANALIHKAAARCMSQLQPLAARPSDPDLDPEQPVGLMHRQAQLLQHRSHPFKMDEFRFYLPITGPLRQVNTKTQTLVFDAAQEFFSDLPPLRFNSLALFAQPAPGTDFVLLDHLEMTR
jgi:hypothetical protein